MHAERIRTTGRSYPSSRCSLGAAVVLVAAILSHTTSASAQDGPFGPCPTDPQTIGPITGSFGNAGAVTIPLPVTMHPCQVFWIEVTVSQPPDPLFPSGRAVGLLALNSAGAQIATSSANSLNSTRVIPRSDDFINFPTVDGTADPSMRLDTFRIVAGASDAYPLSYSVTFHLASRPGFNRGGTSFAEAVQTSAGDTIKLSLPPNVNPNPKQYFRMTLNANQSVRFTGTLSNRHPSQQSIAFVGIYDAETHPLAALTGMIAPAGAVDAPFSTTAYRNLSGQTNDYFVVFQANSSVPLHQAVVTPSVFQLKLFLDSDANPNDGGANYLPGSDSSGISKAVPMSTAIEDITVVAAYVESDGTIVAPPSTSQVSFKLSNVSAFAGMAMNWADVRGTADGGPEPANGPYLPDITMPGSTTSGCTPAPARCLSSTFVNNTARVTLKVWDYGAFGTIDATHASVSALSMRLPKDATNNWLPDAGWIANGVLVPDDVQNQWEDSDQNPTVSGPPSGGLLGDGLSRFEEYRGFVVRGQHVRTDPRNKDLFLASAVTSPSNQVIGIGYATNLPLIVHQVVGEGEMNPPEYYYPTTGQHTEWYRSVNWNYRNSSPAGNLQGHREQKAVLVRSGNVPQPADPMRVNLANTAYLLYPGGCSPSLGGLPSELPDVTIDLTQHINVGNSLGETQAQVDNELRRTVAHEIGHTVHVRHRGNPNPPPCPEDGAPVGTQDSVMSSEWASGPPPTAPFAGYNSDDVAQIRLVIP